MIEFEKETFTTDETIYSFEEMMDMEGVFETPGYDDDKFFVINGKLFNINRNNMSYVNPINYKIGRAHV